MATRDWEFTLDGKQHRFKLVHGMGERRFFLDGNLLLEQKERGNGQFCYLFQVGNHTCEVNIFKIANANLYSCFVDDDYIPALQDKKWGKEGKINIYASQRIFWFELIKALKVNPIPHYPHLGYLGQPLIGDVGGFLTMIHFVPMQNNIPFVYALIRFRSLEDTKALKADLNQIATHAGIIRKSSLNGIETLSNTHVILGWIFDSKKMSPEQFRQSLGEVIGIISRHTSGISPFKCENPACKHPSDTNVKLVLVNGYPSWMCASCIAELDSLGERTKEDYKQAPLNFGRGLVAGILAAFAGSLAWAALMILFDFIAAALSAFILLGIVKAMDWVKAKRTFWSILIAGALSVGGSILGSYLGGLWTTVSKGGVSLTFIFESFENFIWYLGFVWNGLWEKTTIMGTTIMFSVLGVGVYLWSFWRQHRNQLKRAFKPEIHVVDS